MNYFPSVNLGVPPYIPAIAVTENLQSNEPRDERQAFVKKTFAFKVETVNPFAFGMSRICSGFRTVGNKEDIPNM